MWVAWQVWERTVRRPWTVTMPPGVALHLAPHDPVTSGVLYCGLPDWPEMRLVLDYLRAGDVMLDVGANVGLYSLLSASIDGVRAIAFEPDDGARRTAERNVARNGLGTRVEIRAEAVGPAAGTSDFSLGLGPENRLLSNGSSHRGLAEVRTVELVALDDVVLGPVALVKIDVEGEELGVLGGAEGLLRRERPVLIVEANDPEALTEHLGVLGYHWVTYDPALRRAAHAEPPAKGANGIAVADLHALRGRLSAS